MIGDDGILPSGWVRVKLEELGMGRTRSVDPAKHPDKEFELWSVPSFPSGDPEIQIGADIGSTKQHVEPGDVLLCKINPRINRVWVVERRHPFEQIASSEWIVFRNSEVEPLFLMHRLREGVFRDRLCADVSGVGGSLTRARPQTVKNLDITLPPIAEQRRIVAKIEVLQQRSRKARETLAEVGPLLEQYRQSLLAAAFRGDLTAAWRAARPDVEPASELLNRIRKGRRQKWEQAELAKYKAKGKPAPKAWRDRYKEPEPVDESELPELPDGWCWCRLGMLGCDPLNTVQTGPFGAQLHRNEFVASGVPVIAVGNLTGVGFTRKNLYFVNGIKAEQLSRYDVQARDVLFARSGATLGKVCVAPEFVRDWRMTGHILRARLNAEFVFPEFAVYALWGDPAVKTLVTKGIRGMTRPGYNTTLLNAIPLPLPPISEQQQILHVIENAFARIDNVVSVQAEADSNFTQLDQSILAKAFRGEMVPQDSSDEPASVLLERIRQQRAAQSEKRKRTLKDGRRKRKPEKQR